MTRRTMPLRYGVYTASVPRAMAAVALAAAGILSALPAQAEEHTAVSVVVLSGGGLWRKHDTFFPPRVSTETAKAAGLATDAASRAETLAARTDLQLRTAPPPDGWTDIAFDDSAWRRDVGGEFSAGDSRTPQEWPIPVARATDPFVPEVGLVAMRGKFLVADPGQVRGLRLSLGYRGGFIAYLNGEEIARAHLPGGRLSPETPAEPYGLDAFLAPPDDAGNRIAWNWWTHRDEPLRGKWTIRERQAGPISVDPGLLRKGLNVLALELHRTEYPAECRDKRAGLCFATVGLATLRFEADAPAGCITSSPARPAGLHAWNRDVIEPVYANDRPDPAEGLRPIRIVAARNGRFSGQIVVGSTGPIQGLQVQVTDLVTADGKGRIPAAALQVRYGGFNPTQTGCEFHYRRRLGVTAPRFDLLVASPPDRIAPLAPGNVSDPVRRAMDLPPGPEPAAVLPVWVTVHVPKEAVAGDYAASLIVRAKGAPPIRVPVEVSVADWTLPDVKDYGSLLFIYQSPDTLAEYYQVPRWSEAHWRLIEASLDLMGRAGNIGLIFPLLARTRAGNVESMVPWIRRSDGTWDYDFTTFDRYLATALKYHDPGRLRVIAVNIWGHELDEPTGAAKGVTRRALLRDTLLREKSVRGALVTVLDPATGAKTEMRLPDYARPEAEALWRPLLLAIRQRLAKRGLADRLMIGMSDDGNPPPEHVAMVRRILPDARWFRDAHPDQRGVPYDAADPQKMMPVGCNSIVWAGPVPDPREKRGYGWQVDPNHLVLSFNRAGVHHLYFVDFAPPSDFRVWMESTLAYGRNGVGRVGGDFFRFSGTARLPIDNRYPDARCLGNTQLLHATSDLFGPGPVGPVPTMRLANALEGNQEAEARIAIERALVDAAHPLPAALAQACQALLDERTDALRLWPLGRHVHGLAGWRDRNRRLFAAAAEVQRALRPLTQP